MITIKLDPLNKFTHVDPRDILESLGLIPFWASVADEHKDFKESLLLPNHYGDLYMGDMTGGNVTEEGYFTYPEDPDLAPIAMWKYNDEVMYQYQHAIIAVVNLKTGNQWVTRMD